MRRALVALALALLLAGCASRGGPFGSFPQTCSASVAWHEEGLYDALAAAAQAAGIALAQDQRSPAQWSVEHPALAQRWREHEVESVSRQQNGAGFRLWPWAPGEVAVEAPGAAQWNDTMLLANFSLFLEPLGLDAHPERPAWERALVASRGHGPYPRSVLALWPDLGPLLDRMVEEGIDDSEKSMASGSLAAGDWQVRVAIGRHHLVVPTDDGRFELFVDERDNARVFVETSEDGWTPTTLWEETNATFARLGLAAPSYANATGDASRC